MPRSRNNKALLAAGFTSEEIQSAYKARQTIRNANLQLDLKASSVVYAERHPFKVGSYRGLYYVLRDLFTPLLSPTAAGEKLADAIDPTFQFLPDPLELQDDSGLEEIRGHLALITFSLECWDKIFSKDGKTLSQFWIYPYPISYNTGQEKANADGDMVNFKTFTSFTKASPLLKRVTPTDRFAFAVTKTENWVGHAYLDKPLHAWIGWISKRQNGRFQLFILDPNFISVSTTTIHKSGILPAQVQFIVQCLKAWKTLDRDHLFLLRHPGGNPDGRCLQLCSKWLQKLLSEEGWREFPWSREKATSVGVQIEWSDGGRRSTSRARQKSGTSSVASRRSLRYTSRESSLLVPQSLQRSQLSQNTILDSQDTGLQSSYQVLPILAQDPEGEKGVEPCSMSLESSGLEIPPRGGQPHQLSREPSLPKALTLYGPRGIDEAIPNSEDTGLQSSQEGLPLLYAPNHEEEVKLMHSSSALSLPETLRGEGEDRDGQPMSSREPTLPDQQDPHLRERLEIAAANSEDTEIQCSQEGLKLLIEECTRVERDSGYLPSDASLLDTLHEGEPRGQPSIGLPLTRGQELQSPTWFNVVTAVSREIVLLPSIERASDMNQEGEKGEIQQPKGLGKAIAEDLAQGRNAGVRRSVPLEIQGKEGNSSQVLPIMCHQSSAQTPLRSSQSFWPSDTVIPATQEIEVPSIIAKRHGSSLSIDGLPYKKSRLVKDDGVGTE